MEPGMSSHKKGRWSTSVLSTLCVLAGISIVPPARAQAKPETDARLKFVLVLTRHGVRSPTWTNDRLDEYSRDPWPKWEVAPGELTPHGKILMTQFGTYYRASLADRGLLSLDGCADAGKVYIAADTDNRTDDTGHSLADGLMPGCNVEVHSLGKGKQDVLFHFSSKEIKPDTQLGFFAVTGHAGGDPSAILAAYETPLNAMQQVLAGCSGPNCAAAVKKSLLGEQPSLAPGTGDHVAEFKGPLSIGATFAENLQLEYLNGMPDAEVGWGRVDEAKIRSLMALHAASSELMQRTPYVARVQASNLLFHIVRTLEQAEEGKAVNGAIATPQQKVVFLTGHDTNISNVSALLDAHWFVNGYQRDDAAPGGALVFELWQKPGQQDDVRVYYTVQTPVQMRKVLPLSLAEPPAKAAIFIPQCSRAEQDTPCSWTAFDRTIEAVIDDQFVR
jgi:4-phytase/acid phosphatase